MIVIMNCTLEYINPNTRLKDYQKLESKYIPIEHKKEYIIVKQK